MRHFVEALVNAFKAWNFLLVKTDDKVFGAKNGNQAVGVRATGEREQLRTHTKN